MLRTQVGRNRPDITCAPFLITRLLIHNPEPTDCWCPYLCVHWMHIMCGWGVDRSLNQSSTPGNKQWKASSHIQAKQSGFMSIHPRMYQGTLLPRFSQFCLTLKRAGSKNCCHSPNSSISDHHVFSECTQPLKRVWELGLLQEMLAQVDFALI